MKTIITFAITLALLSLAIAAPAEEGKKEDVEGRIGFGGGAFGSGLNQGGSFGVDSQGDRYGQGGFGYNVGRLNRRDTGKSATHGDSESSGLSGSSGHNRQLGQGSSRQRRQKTTQKPSPKPYPKHGRNSRWWDEPIGTQARSRSG